MALQYSPKIIHLILISTFLLYCKCFELGPKEFIYPKEINNDIYIFENNNQKYIVYGEMHALTYMEAKIICEARWQTGKLAILDTKDALEFIITVLTSIETKRKNYWIGASKQDTNATNIVNNITDTNLDEPSIIPVTRKPFQQKKFPPGTNLDVNIGSDTEEPSVEKNGDFLFNGDDGVYNKPRYKKETANEENEHLRWVWKNGDPLKSNETKYLRGFDNVTDDPQKLCLALQRDFLQLSPLFVVLDCTLKRPYICQTDSSEIINGTVIAQSIIRVEQKLYYPFYGQKTWAEAILYCKENNLELATFNNETDFMKISKLLRQTRPTIRLAWIGAKHNEEDHYEYIETQEVIPNEKSNGYPPWPESPYKKISGCLLIEQQLNGLVFHAERCQRPLPFICEKELSKYVPSVWEKPDGGGFVLIYIAKSWKGAKDYCERHDMKLAEPKTVEYLNRINELMSERNIEVEHVWLGGKWDPMGTDPPTKWRWSTSGEEIPMEQYNKLIPDIEDIAEKKFCLNLDQAHHNKLVIYGIPCNDREYFVCENRDGEPLPENWQTFTPLPPLVLECNGTMVSYYNCYNPEQNYTRGHGAKHHYHVPQVPEKGNKTNCTITTKEE